MARKKDSPLPNMRRFEERFSKTFGDGVLQRGVEPSPYEVIPTGSLSLDVATGVGGWVEGRMNEVWGVDGSGKTRLSIMGMVEAQRKHPDKMVVFIDVEHRHDKAWMRAHGLDLSRCYLVLPAQAEDVADILKEILLDGNTSFAVVDSVGAMLPKAEFEKDAEDVVVGKQAKIITRMVKMGASLAAQSGTAVLFINQVRANIGSYGADTTTGGGWALRHSTTMKMKMRRTSTPPLKAKIAGEDRLVGYEAAITVERNSVAAPHRTAMVTFLNVPTADYGPIGVDRVVEAATLGVKLGVIRQEGAWYTLPGGDRFQGKEKLTDAIRDMGIADDLRDAVLEADWARAEDAEEARVAKPRPKPKGKARSQPSFDRGADAMVEESA